MINEYLAHYGIKGQKWGIRRFQDANGKLTSEGRRRAKMEYKADNKVAFQKGKMATLTARAADYAEKRYQRAEKYSHSNKKKAIRKENAEFWREQANKSEREAKEHYDRLVSKYGKDAVSGIKRDKKGRINENISTGKQKVGALLATGVLYTTFSALGSPIAPVILPATKTGAAREMAYQRELTMRRLGKGKVY